LQGHVGFQWWLGDIFMSNIDICADGVAFGRIFPQRTPPTPVYEKIKSLIVEQKIRPGEHIRVTDLAELLSVSHTPIREALSRLEAEGLISSVHNKGYFSKPIDIDEAVNLYKAIFLLMRHALEIFENNTPDTAIVSELLDKIENQVPFDECSYAECAYLSVVELSRNRVIYPVVDNFIVRTRYLRKIALSDSRHSAVFFLYSKNLVLHMRELNTEYIRRSFDAELKDWLDAIPNLIREAIVRNHS
jgi:DNA-binding GntR family transcriptional regulator